MVLSILRSRIAMERCYEVYRAEADTENAMLAIFLLAGIADFRALPWVSEFLNDKSSGIRWNGLMVLRTILEGPLGDEGIATARELLKIAESDSDLELCQRAKEIKSQFSSILVPSRE